MRLQALLRIGADSLPVEGDRASSRSTATSDDYAYSTLL